MAKTYVNTVKYNIICEFEIKGVVDKPDIVGAIFGQSEGLLGEEMDLRELQKNGRIGRIEIKHRSQGGVTRGSITIPSSMDMVETSLLAAAMETVDKVGPCEAKFSIKTIDDTRASKREVVAARAQELLARMRETQVPDSMELAEQVRETTRAAKIQEYGREKLPCGPDIETDDSIIVVEGRADVINLLRNSIKNVIGMGGSRIPRTVTELTKKKTTTIFVDGDRGGELNIRKLAQLGKIDFIARAPDGKEVEELARKEIIQALRRKVAYDPALLKRPFRFPEKPAEETMPPAEQTQLGAEEEEKGRPLLPKMEAIRAPFASAFSKLGLGKPEGPPQRQETEPRLGGQEPRFGGQDRPFGGFGGRDREGGFDRRPGRDRDSRGPRDRGFRDRDSRDRGGPRDRDSRGPRDRDSRDRRGPRGRDRGPRDRGPPRGGDRFDRGAFERAPLELISAEERATYQPVIDELANSLKAKFLDDKNKEIAAMAVREMLAKLDAKKKVHALVFDGIITKRVVDEAKKAGVKVVVGIKKGKYDVDPEVKTIALTPQKEKK